MTVLPEVRDALLMTARRHLELQAAANAAPKSAVRRRVARRGTPLIAIGVFAVAGAATATGLVVSQATKDQAARLSDAPDPTTGTKKALGDPMAAEAAAIGEQLPYPPGMSDNYEWKQYAAGATLGTGGESQGEIRLMVEARAACLWRRYYVKSYDQGDRRGMTDAAEILHSALDWPGRRVSGFASGSADPEKMFAAEAADRSLSEASRRYVQVNCYDRSKDELQGKVPLIERHD